MTPPQTSSKRPDDDDDDDNTALGIIVPFAICNAVVDGKGRSHMVKQHLSP